MKAFFEKFSRRLIPSLYYGLLVFIGLSLISLALFKRTEKESMTYPFVLPALPYVFNALEPHIDALTMEIHHDKHHQEVCR